MEKSGELSPKGQSARSWFFKGMRAELPIVLGGIPFGLIYGVVATGAGVPSSITQAMSAIIFAGSAQLVTVQLIGLGTPAFTLIVTASIINARHLLYSASIAPYLRPLRAGWKVLLAYLLTDEAYVVAIAQYLQPGSATRKRWFFLGAGLALWIDWQLSTAAGLLLGAHIPASWGLDFAPTLTFIALAVPLIKSRAGVVTALVAGGIAIFASALPLRLGLVLAAVIGTLAGWLWERRQHPTAPEGGQP